MMNSQRQQSNIPEGLASKLRASRANHRMRIERRVITMLFCDVTGSTSMAEQLDAEEWAENYAALSQKEAITSMRAEAMESAAIIAANIGDPEMRDRFLNRYELQELI